MSDLVNVTGRRMTGQLQRALDNLTGADRRRAIRVLRESESPALGAIHRALAAELLLARGFRAPSRTGGDLVMR